MHQSRALVEVFCSSVEEDAPFQESLERHLSMLRRSETIVLWHRRKVTVGGDWKRELDEHLGTASLILLLISPDFLASDYTYGVELQRAMQRHDDGQARVIPILLRSCDWEEAPFARCQILPRNLQAITAWSNLDQAFTEVAKEIRNALEDRECVTSNPFPATFPKIWQIPYQRNPVFTGREQLLAQLAEALQMGHTTALSQPQAISGLGGIGKTQIAVEYAYRHRHDYKVVLWARADTREALISGYVSIAHQLNLPQKDEQDQVLVVQVVLRWLTTQVGWLLILDSADDLTTIREFLPIAFDGHILLTTRAQAMGRLASRLEVNTMDGEVGALLLVRRAGLVAHNALLEAASPADLALAREITEELGGLPLALDQAGAYIEETQCSFVDYLKLYQTHRQKLLAERGKLATDYPESVATTWSLSFDKVHQANPAASELLQLCAFLAPDGIPEDLIKDGATHWPVLLQEVATDPYAVWQMIKELLKFSLIKPLEKDRVLSIHRLVQAVQRDRLSEQDRQQWAVRVVRAVRTALPPVEPAHWPRWKLIMPHAQLCAQYIKAYEMQFTPATDLLSETGLYLVKHAQYKEAKELYRDCLNIFEKSQYPDSFLPKTIVLINLGNVSSETGEYKEAVECYKKGQDIFKRNKELNRHEFTRLLNSLAILFKVQGKPKGAEKLYIRSLNMQIQSFVASGEALGKPGEAKKKQSAPDDLDIATLSKVLRKSKEEINRYIHCLLAQQTVERKFAQVLNNLAVLYAEQLHKYETAERLFHLSLWLQKQHMGHDTPNEEHDLRQYDSEYALSLNNLANLYTVWGGNPEVQSNKRRTLYQQAASFYRESENMLKKWHDGVDHPEIAYPLLGQGILHFEQGRYKEAKEYYLKSLAIWKNLRRYHPQTGYVYYNLANLYFRYKEAKEAKEYYQECLDIWKKHLGPRHLHTCTCKEMYAILCRNPKGDTNVLKAELVVLPTYRSFRL